MLAATVAATGSKGAGFASGTPDLDFVSALDAAAAIRSKRISSVELTERMLARIERYNPTLDAFVYITRERALREARKADQAIMRGEPLRVFEGVPFAIKESFAVKGEPDTWGIPELKNTKAPADAAAVERLEAGGAVLTGGTNVPLNLMDWQSYNAIYGTTNNPWDLSRTPGGSSGGSAAALAAGLTYLSVGSDIGGSLRVPAMFCGVYSHKPTMDLVSTRGQIPGGFAGLHGFSTGLAVAGPMARSARDLAAALTLLGGPDGYDKKAWSWKMPAPRRRRLKDYRVGFVMDDPMARPTSEVKPVLERALAALERAGVQLRGGWPSGYELNQAAYVDQFLLSAFNFTQEPAEQQALERKIFEKGGNAWADGALTSYERWQKQRFQQLAHRQTWQDYFEGVDVFLMPAAFSVAFRHIHDGDMNTRSVDTPEGKRPYMDFMPWIVTPTLTGCPSTTAPVGLTATGLPVAIQVMGPFWEDATPIEFAALLADEIGGFAVPPGYTA